MCGRTRDNTCRHPPLLSGCHNTIPPVVTSIRPYGVSFSLTAVCGFVLSCRGKGEWSVVVAYISFVRGPSSLPTLRNRGRSAVRDRVCFPADRVPCSRRCLTRYLVITRGPDPFGSRPRLSFGPQGTGRVTHRETYTTTAPHFPE